MLPFEDKISIPHITVGELLSYLSQSPNTLMSAGKTARPAKAKNRSGSFQLKLKYAGLNNVLFSGRLIPRYLDALSP
jgi:hypothetical protein